MSCVCVWFLQGVIGLVAGGGGGGGGVGGRGLFPWLGHYFVGVKVTPLWIWIWGDRRVIGNMRPLKVTKSVQAHVTLNGMLVDG